MPAKVTITKQRASSGPAIRRDASADVAAIAPAAVGSRLRPISVLLGAAAVAATPAAIFPLTPAFSADDALAAVIAASIAAAAAVGVVALANAAASSGSPTLGRERLLYAAGLFSAGAGAIHLAVSKTHFEEYALFGVFFVGAGVAQIVWGIWVVLRRWSPLFVVGALGNAVIAAFWFVDRIWGLPLGPERWQPDPVGFGDTATTALEVLVVMGCIGLLAGAAPRSQPLRPLLAVALTLAVTAVTVLSLLSVLGVGSSILTPTE